MTKERLPYSHVYPLGSPGRLQSYGEGHRLYALIGFQGLT
jgi:hypothetical protein